jgi:hypothetical protein
LRFGILFFSPRSLPKRAPSSFASAMEPILAVYRAPDCFGTGAMLSGI